jgi:mono/diheme cytochrome c family protein
LKAALRNGGSIRQEHTMSQHTRLWRGWLAAMILIVGGGAAAQIPTPTTPAPAQPVSTPQATVPHGSYLFRTYCASCHGEDARGNGPLAASLRRRPPNLTEIAKRNKGVFPQTDVFKIIDGREKVAGHGGPDMPVWGDAFQRSVEIRDEAAVAARIQALVDYLQQMQLRSAQ